jgi:hypothetical protein
MPRKLTETEVETIRGLGAAGIATGEIATRFSISERHARRLLTDLPPPRLEVRGRASCRGG